VRSSKAAESPSQPADEWQRVRAIVLARDGMVCQSCGQPCRASETDVHHLVPRAAGGIDHPANLITLCDGCHAARHPNLQGQLARRMIERWGLRLAKWLDRQRQLTAVTESLGAALRLFGATRFRDRQLDVVLAALRGESVLLVSPTGSGKTLCFQVPVVLRDGFGLVISPLKALMSSQVASLTEKKVPATFINGDLGPSEKKIRYQLLRDHAVKFLYCTPERFDPSMVRPAEVEVIAQTRPEYLVVDEAHCIDRWGSDFRPAYGRLGAIRRTLGSPPVLAFTATAGVPTQRRILESLEIPDARVVVTSVDRPNIALARLPGIEDEHRLGLIARLLRVLPKGRAMIFVPTVRVGQQVQSGLRERELDLPFYHSRLGTANERDMLLGQFTGRLSPPVNYVICTTAFGMGLDVPDVRLVVHWQHPASIEDYLQEFGRAGRDRRPSVALLFTQREDDVRLLRFMAEKTIDSAGLDGETRSGVLATKYEAIEQMAQCASMLGACFRNSIIDYFEGPRTVKRRSLSARIVEWIYSRVEQIAKPQACCDRCDQVGIANVETWVGQVLRTDR
jgi:ATP-dependent DNA helicase RecQ